MEKSPWLLIRCGVQRPSAQMNGLTGADAAPARAGQSARSTQSRRRGLRAGRTMEPRFANDLNISLGPRINVLQINKSVKNTWFSPTSAENNASLDWLALFVINQRGRGVLVDGGGESVNLTRFDSRRSISASVSLH